MELRITRENTVVQPLKNLPAFYETWRFIAAFEWALNRYPSWSRQIQSIQLYPSNINLNIIPPTYVLVFLAVSFLLAYTPLTYMRSSSPNSCYMLCPSHPPSLDNSNYTERRVKGMMLLIMQPSPPPCQFIPLRSKYSPQLLSTWCW
jgi:hypothetical protein